MTGSAVAAALRESANALARDERGQGSGFGLASEIG